MRQLTARPILIAALLIATGCENVPQETAYGKGLTDANKERLVIDDMTDVSDWYYAKDEETTLSSSKTHVKNGTASCLFSTKVNHKSGEKKYPMGWPRTGKRLADAKLTDWSGYDFFECWIYTETNRDKLPGKPLGLGFNHTSHKSKTSLSLNAVKKDEWVRIVIPIEKLEYPKDVQGFQFHISESSYRHGDQVDFYINDAVLTRYVDPVIEHLSVNKKLIYSNDQYITARYTIMGRKGMGRVKAEFEIGRGITAPVAKAEAVAVRNGEISVVPPPTRLRPGTYWARLSLRDADGKLIDRKQTEFRVLGGPF